VAWASALAAINLIKSASRVQQESCSGGSKANVDVATFGPGLAERLLREVAAPYKLDTNGTV